jgi:hypothetical protein
MKFTDTDQLPQMVVYENLNYKLDKQIFSLDRWGVIFYISDPLENQFRETILKIRMKSRLGKLQNEFY